MVHAPQRTHCLTQCRPLIAEAIMLTMHWHGHRELLQSTATPLSRALSVFAGKRGGCTGWASVCSGRSPRTTREKNEKTSKLMGLSLPGGRCRRTINGEAHISRRGSGAASGKRVTKISPMWVLAGTRAVWSPRFLREPLLWLPVGAVSHFGSRTCGARRNTPWGRDASAGPWPVPQLNCATSSGKQSVRFSPAGRPGKAAVARLPQ